MAKSRITAVTVMTSGAVVTRRADLNADEIGAHGVLRLDGLPLCLADSSLRTRLVNAPVGLSVSHLRVGLAVPDQGDPDLRPPARDEDLDQARHELLSVEQRIKQVEAMILRLQALRSPDRPRGARGEKPPPSPAVARLALLDFRRNELEQCHQEVGRLHETRHQAQDRLRQLEDRRQRASGDRRLRREELRKSVHVQLQLPDHELPGLNSVQLELSYVVPGARWVPGYTLRFTPDFSAADLQMRAMVCQSSGEDWSDVKLELSTADHLRWTDLPELSELRIGRAQPAPPRAGWRPPPTGAEQLFSDYDRARSQVCIPPEAGAEEAAEEMADLAADYPDAEPGEMMAGACLDEAVTGAMAAPAPPQAAKRGKVMAKNRAPMRLSLSHQSVTPPPEAPPAELRAEDRFLDFAGLRMPAPDGEHRGELQAPAAEELYSELLVHVDVDVRIEVQVALREAVDRARQVAHLDPPTGYEDPGPWQDFDFSYRASNPVSVAADGCFHSVPLLNRTAPCALRYVTVPRENSDVFRFAKLENPLAAPLPRGPAEVFAGSDFLLGTTLHPVPPKAEVDIGLGVEQALKVARNTTFSEESSGLLGGTLRLVHGINVEIRNHLPEAVSMEVRERLPITRPGDDAVEVEVIDVDPAWQRFAQQSHPLDGGYLWLVEVTSGGRKNLSASYAVIISAKHELVGGNRRES